jgi:transcriptional regulator with XRE-family HTH domain
MSELGVLRLSVGVTQEQMAAEMGLSLRDYLEIERGAIRLDDFVLRSATFAVFRIAVAVDEPVDFPLAAMVQELNGLF